jgi:hypothetical protein
MNGNRSARRWRVTGWAALCGALAMLATSACTPLLVAERSGGHQQETPSIVDTATGSYRTGLTKAGLVKLEALGDMHLFVSQLGGSDRNAFDVRVELLNDGAPVASGLSRCLGNLPRSSQAARELVVPWDAFARPTLHVGGVLALRVSARIGTNPDGTQCTTNGRHAAGGSSGLRVSFDAPHQPSRFAATITPDPSVDLYLHGSSCNKRGSQPLRLSESVPSQRRASCMSSGPLHYGGGNAWAEVGMWRLPPQCDCANKFIPAVRNNPPAPKPEPVTVDELPLPPTALATNTGACTTAVNPRGTGCMDAGPEAIQSGSFFPDGRSVSVQVTFTGAPATGPSSIYAGLQLIAVKTDGTTFPNGDPWRCITCGVPDANRQNTNAELDYPQPFRDGKRVLWGSNIVECSAPLLGSACTPAQTHIYPLYWRNRTEPDAATGNLRELRLHPDQVHIGFNHIVLSPVLNQFGYLGRLQFDPAPPDGTPRVPRYDIVNVFTLFNERPQQQPWQLDPAHPGEVRFSPLEPTVGELRSFSRDGKEVTYIGNPAESDNIDVFATDLTTGKTRRLTANPEYTDPIDLSPDNNWTVAMDTRGSGRQLFMAAMEGIPPINDMLTVAAVSSVRNNHQRRFFQPILIDRYGDRGAYQGQQLNAGDDAPGSISDPNWNGRADPRWSPDGTSVAYWQSLVTAPACGGVNSLPCPPSTEPGERRTRLMIARLTSRTPTPAPVVAPISDVVPWGTQFDASAPGLVRPHLPTGTYTLRGKVFGHVVFTVTENATRTAVASVSATYTNFSDDGVHVINGTESASGSQGFTLQVIDWHSNLRLTGCQTGAKVTSEPGGFHLEIDLSEPVFQATGTLTTTIDGQVYRQPANGT